MERESVVYAGYINESCIVFLRFMKKRKGRETEKKGNKGIISQTLLLEVLNFVTHPFELGTESQPRSKSMTGPKPSIGRWRINDELQGF